MAALPLGLMGGCGPAAGPRKYPATHWVSEWLGLRMQNKEAYLIYEDQPFIAFKLDLNQRINPNLITFQLKQFCQTQTEQR